MKPYKPKTLTTQQVSQNKILQSLIEDIFNPDNKSSDYKKCWNAKDFNLLGQMNPYTKNIYKGSNALLLSYVQAKNNYKSSLWLTLNNMITLFGKENAYKVIKDNKYSNIFYFSMQQYEKKKDNEPILGEDGLPLVGFIPKYNYYNVMNLSQLVGKIKEVDKIINDLEKKYAPKKVEKTIPLSELENAMIKGINLKNGMHLVQRDRACYYPNFDSIDMPIKESFDSEEHFLSTLGHEIGHATGHESRLNRKLNNSFSSNSYAYEELVAEFTSSLLDAYYGNNCKLVAKNHVCYLKSWYESLRKNPTKLFKACADSEKAFEYIRNATDKELIKKDLYIPSDYRDVKFNENKKVA